MGTEITSAKPSAWAGAVRKTKKFFKWLIFLLVVFLGVFIYW